MYDGGDYYRDLPSHPDPPVGRDTPVEKHCSIEYLDGFGENVNRMKTNTKET
jgi:hypothetical protein